MKKLFSYLSSVHNDNRTLIKQGMYILLANAVANITNLLYQLYLGRNFTTSDFGMVSLFTSLTYLSQILLGGFSRTIVHHSAYLLGKYNSEFYSYWQKMHLFAVSATVVSTVLWIMCIPLLAKIFHAESIMPFILFTPLWITGYFESVNSGYLNGIHKFGAIAVMTVVEAVIKLISAIVLVELNFASLVYISSPLGLIASLLASYLFIFKSKSHDLTKKALPTLQFSLPFFFSATLTRFSSLAFVSLDIILVKYFLPPEDAGQYALLSLVGKMVFFIGSVFSQFINPLVSRKDGAKEETEKILYFLLTTISLLSLGGYVVVGLFGKLTVPLIFGTKTYDILPYLPFFTIAMVFINIAGTFVSYHQAKKHYLFSYTSFVLGLAQISGIALFHESIMQVVMTILVLSVLYLICMIILHVWFGQIDQFFKDVSNFFQKEKTLPQAKRNILIFNWRDIKHIWAGGAEVYVHEVAKRWVQEGNNVTIFAGNDGRSSQNQVIDGVRMYRRGGTYTVYLWAPLYYLAKLRGQYDVIIDCENGIPFFTPLFVRKPITLLIHHIHQEVFRKYMPFPISSIASFLEGRVMPVVYRNKTIITISNSSKKEILKLGLGRKENIHIVHPGINPLEYKPMAKSDFPYLSYVGRLKPYKNVDTAVKAFAKILPLFPTAKLAIVGMGDSIFELRDLVKSLKLSKAVTFHGKVTKEKKAEILAKSWICLQPSMVEGWGITVIEANACGTAVIASNVNGLKDSLMHGKTGVLVPPLDEDFLSQTIIMLCQNKSLFKRLGKNGQLWAKKFNWDTSALQFITILDEAIQKSTRQLSLRTAGAFRKGNV